jgi:hypothetical protein
MSYGPTLALALILALPLASATLDYGVEAGCDGPCQEGGMADLAIRVRYDVPALNDRQYLLYNRTNPLQQTFTSRITVTRVTLRDKVFNTTFFDAPADMAFADRRIRRNAALDAETKELRGSAILPRPTQAATLSYVPCFTLEYERELRQYDFYTGDYMTAYITDTVEQCGNKVLGLQVEPRPVPACIERDCSWHQACDPAAGCRTSWGKVAFIIVAALAIAVGGYRFIMHEPKREVRWERR